jgi:ribosome maturation protein SDO1
VDPTKSAKQQALAALPRLQKVFPIKRAEMRFRLTVPTLDLASATQDMLANENATIEKQAECEIVCTADPSVYRSLDKFAKETSVQLEVVTMAVMEGGVSETFHEMESTRGGAASASGAGDGDGAYAMRDMDGALAGAVPGGDGEAKMAKAAAAPRVRRAGGDEIGGGGGEAAAAPVEVFYPRGPIAGMPEEHASRRDRFVCIDEIQGGWLVELRRRGGSSVVDAVFFSPDGVLHKSFAEARREAMRAKREGAA